MEARDITVPAHDLRVTRTEAIPRWSLGSRLALGVWTFSMPLAAVALALYALASAPLVPPVLLGGVYYLIICHVILSLFYLSFAGQNPRLNDKVLWMTSLVLFGPVSILAYWVIHVWGAPMVGNDDVDSVIPQHRARPAHTATALPLGH